MKNNRSQFKACGPECPVENVNWYEALAFANALSKQSGWELCYKLSVDNGKDPRAGVEYEGVTSRVRKTAIYTGVMTIESLRNRPELNEIAWYGGNSGVTYQETASIRAVWSSPGGSEEEERLEIG